MAQKSPPQILRLIPAALLKRFFWDYLGVLQELNFAKIEETGIDPILEAMRTLPEEKQARIEGALRLVDAMACPGGILALADEA